MKPFNLQSNGQFVPAISSLMTGGHNPVILSNCMGATLYHSRSFTVENSSKIACLTTGWRGKISGYAEPINALNERGFTVIGYEFNPIVLIGGKPQAGVDLLNGICDDFSKRSAGLKEIICVGSSAGAGLGLALQRRLPGIKYGIYAGAGEPGKDVLARPLFCLLRKRFEKSGASSDEVRRLWRELDIGPDEPPRDVAFVIVLGKKRIGSCDITKLCQPWPLGRKLVYQ